VVADSKPESEYAEALEKLRPLLAALDAARETDSI
jgi:anthranilate/para-aminobenzoate synthase component I